MPLQNRVTPEGLIVAVPARGLMMGNRGGCFHRADKSLKARQWASRQWICCVLSFKERHRDVFSPGRYTELFFLDEATALAAGHRPCFECRRSDAVAFAAAWSQAMRLPAPPSAPDMDVVLHGERRASAARLPPRQSLIEEVPNGAFVLDRGTLALMQDRRLHRWTHWGYEPGSALEPGRLVQVITPQAIVAVLSAGYRAAVHPTAV